MSNYHYRQYGDIAHAICLSDYLIKARDRCLIFLYLEWVFGKSNCEEFQIAFPYRNGLTKFFKGLRQIATMNIIANIMGILYTLKRILRR